MFLLVMHEDSPNNVLVVLLNRFKMAAVTTWFDIIIMSNGETGGIL